MSDVHPGVLPALDEPSDAELMSAVRGGDVDAYGTLFERHVDAARRLARQLVSAGDVDDLVSEAFTKVLGVLQRGGGPDLAFRAYLLTSVRRLHVDKLRSSARLTTTDDMTAYDAGVPFEDTAVAGFDSQAAARAFAQLPERWQQVLWHTEVEGQKPAEIAPLLGMSANSVSALAYRAREGLRQAFISMHAQDAVDDACATTRANLGAYIRGGLSRRDSAKVEAHLRDCRACTAVYLELTEVNSNLGALLAPLVLGSVGAAYLAGAGAGAKAGVLLFFGRGKDWILHNPAGRVVAGVTAAGVVAVAVAVAAQGGNHPQPSPQANNAPSVTAPSATPATPPPSRSTPTPTPKPTPGPTRASTPRASAPSLTQPVAPPAPAPAPTPAPPQTSPIITIPLANITVVPGRATVIDLTKGATNANGDPITVKSASLASPAHGTVVKGSRAARPIISGAGRAGLSSAVPLLVRPTGGVRTVTYTPDAGWRGTDTILYTLTDGHSTARGSVRVITPNTPPVARNDHARVGELRGVGPVSIDVLANDSDANHDRLRITRVTQPHHGTARIQHGEVVYRRAPSFSGDRDSFRYAVSDGHGGTATASVIITFLTPPPPPPPPPPPSPPPPPVSSDAGLTLVRTGDGEHGSQTLQVTAEKIPAGFNATFTFTLAGDVRLVGGSSSDCGPPELSDSCAVGNGEVLDLHFIPSGAWTFTASLAPEGFVDPSPANNTVEASGGQPTG